MNYKYKGAVALAALISAGACGGAWAQPTYDNSGPVYLNTTSSNSYVVFDANGAPLENSQLNPDGTPNASAVCPCILANTANLTPAQQAALDANPNAARFDGATSKVTNVNVDTTSGDVHAVQRTEGGVKTGEAYLSTDPQTGQPIKGTGISAGGVASLDANGNATTLAPTGVTSADVAGNRTTTTASGVVATDASGNQSVFTANGVTVVNTSGASSTVTAGGASFTDASGGNTTISGGDVTSTGTVSGAKVLAGGRDVGQSLADHDATLANHDTRITHVQNQANATDHRLNDFNGTGGTVESWATGVDNWRVDTNAWRADMTGWRDDVNTTLSNYGSRISSLEGWRNVASAQISNLQGRMDKVEGGIALAMASKVPSLETGKTFGVTLNTAFTDSTGAIAGGLAFRLDKNWQINASGGAGFKGGAAGGTVGIVGQW